MAEIKITKKKPVWPWILLVLIILAVLAYFYFESTDPVPYDEETETKAIGAADFGSAGMYAPFTIRA